MGQAFRRAAGRIKPASSIDSTASSLKMESVVDRKPPPRAIQKAEVPQPRESGALDSGNCNLLIVFEVFLAFFLEFLLEFSFWHF